LLEFASSPRHSCNWQMRHVSVACQLCRLCHKQYCWLWPLVTIFGSSYHVRSLFLASRGRQCYFYTGYWSIFLPIDMHHLLSIVWVAMSLGKFDQHSHCLLLIDGLCGHPAEWCPKYPTYFPIIQKCCLSKYHLFWLCQHQ